MEFATDPLGRGVPYGTSKNPEMYYNAASGVPQPVRQTGASVALDHAEGLARQLAMVTADINARLMPMSSPCVAEANAKTPPGVGYIDSAPYFQELQKHLYSIEDTLRHLREILDRLDL